MRCSTEGSTGVVFSDLRNVDKPGACMVAPWAIMNLPGRPSVPESEFPARREVVWCGGVGFRSQCFGHSYSGAFVRGTRYLTVTRAFFCKFLVESSRRRRQSTILFCGMKGGATTDDESLAYFGPGMSESDTSGMGPIPCSSCCGSWDSPTSTNALPPTPSPSSLTALRFAAGSRVT
jgi:hypothetical protein